MKMKFTARRQRAKKATILASKQTVEDALQYAQTLSEYWKAGNENDPRLKQLQSSVDFLSAILNKTPQEMSQDGVSTIEEYFDDTVKPDIADRIKQEVDMITKWRRESNPAAKKTIPAYSTSPAAVPAAKPMASKKADGGAAFSTDRDEKGVAKAPEKVEVPRLAAKDKQAQKPAAAPAAPAATPAPVPAPIPENGTFDIKTLSTEALAKAVKALVSIKEFEEDKSAQALIEQMTAELKTRPIEQEEPKAAPAAAAPAAAPAPIPAAAPVASKKKAYDNPAQAQVSLGGLATAAPEEEPVTASQEKVAVTPPGISEELMHKLKDQYPGEKDKAYATAWKIHNEKEGSLKEVFAALDKIANAQGGSWFVGGGRPIEVTEDGGRTPEIGEAHSKLDESPAKLERPETTLPIQLNKQAAEMTVSKAVKESEKFGNELKRMYLEAKPLTNVNDTRPVREAVESIFRAADLFDEATKVLSKQQVQVESEEAAAKIKAENKGKKSSFLGLAVAASE